MNFWIDASAWVIPVILAVTLHEAAHGWVAFKFGDDTAKSQGRVTFNPLKHIDRNGTILIPAVLMLSHSPFLFGYAKPVPVNFSRLNPLRLGMFMVAIAGVVVNFMQAIIAGLLLHIEALITPEQAPWLFLNLYRALIINCVLIVFNLLPILPLDGGRAVSALLSGKPKRAYSVLENRGLRVRALGLFLPLGIMVVMVGIILAQQLGYNVTETIIGTPANWLLDQVLWLTGNGHNEDVG